MGLFLLCASEDESNSIGMVIGGQIIKGIFKGMNYFEQFNQTGTIIQGEAIKNIYCSMK